jgi:hypothetical protein
MTDDLSGEPMTMVERDGGASVEYAAEIVRLHLLPFNLTIPLGVLLPRSQKRRVHSADICGEEGGMPSSPKMRTWSNVVEHYLSTVAV